MLFRRKVVEPNEAERKLDAVKKLAQDCIDKDMAYPPGTNQWTLLDPRDILDLIDRS